MDSLNVIERVMFLEEIFRVDIPNDNVESFGSEREIVDWLEEHLSNVRPNRDAVDVLKRLAVQLGRPELNEGLNGPWRREQISAIVREVFCEEKMAP